MKNIKANNKLITCSFVLLIGMLCLIGSLFIRYSTTMTDSISDNMIRFHVVANSDTVDDQLLKQKVKDEVIKFIEPMMKKSTSLESTRCLLINSKDAVLHLTEDVIKEWGKDYKVQILLDKANFPTKRYGDLVFPAGEYEAFRIIIGEGKGENWWCVMYPPLCYLDVATGVVPVEGKEELQQQLSSEQYNIVSHQNRNKKYVVKFKLIESINSFFRPSNYKEKK